MAANRALDISTLLITTNTPITTPIKVVHHTSCHLRPNGDKLHVGVRIPSALFRLLCKQTTMTFSTISLAYPGKEKASGKEKYPNYHNYDNS
jgi:hypothetical protein